MAGTQSVPDSRPSTVPDNRPRQSFDHAPVSSRVAESDDLWKMSAISSSLCFLAPCLMGYVFLPGFEFLRVLMLSGRLGFLPHDTTSDDQWPYPMPSDRTHAGSSQFWFLVQWLCNIYGLVSPLKHLYSVLSEGMWAKVQNGLGEEMAQRA
ncbi:hypothetical protein BGY98DRAFT_1103525 [Russula aff. rugulosa BPL654]|nr:hypothetical protein BGY98DRAFT_1103525 [Russula aff. rugulosa BPL654]